MSEMIKEIREVNWRHLLVILMIALVAAGSEGCKTTGKLSKKERKAQIEAAKQQLQPIISGTTTLSFPEQAKIVNNIKARNFNDPELNKMIEQANQIVKAGLAEIKKNEAQKTDRMRASLLDMLLNKDNLTPDQLEDALAALKAEGIPPELSDLVARLEKKIQEMRKSTTNLPIKTQIWNAFQGIADAAKTGNLTQADNTIKNTLQYFSSADALVLIIISKEDGIVDYDKPTTIGRYLQFIKDQKSNRNAIDAMQLDGNGKIKELDLIKNK